MEASNQNTAKDTLKTKNKAVSHRGGNFLGYFAPLIEMHGFVLLLLKYPLCRYSFHL